MMSTEAAIAMNDSFHAINCALQLMIAEWLNAIHIVERELSNLNFAQERKRQLPFEPLKEELFVLHLWRGSL